MKSPESAEKFKLDITLSGDVNIATWSVEYKHCPLVRWQSQSKQINYSVLDSFRVNCTHIP